MITSTRPRRQREGSGPGTRPGWPGWLAVAAWAVLIAASFAVGYALRRAGRMTEDPLPPLFARARLLTWQILPAAGAAAAGVALLPAPARRLRWRPMLLVMWAASAVWAVALAASDGPGAVSAPLTSPNEYLAGLGAVGDDPLAWLRNFTERLSGYPTHTRGHPPLPMLVLWTLDAAGLHGAGWAAALIIAVGTSAVMAIAIALRALAGEDLARRAVPFLVLAPLAVWIATSMDAFFLGVGAWATALAVIAARRGSLACAGAAGLLLGALPYLSYGLVPLFAVPLIVLIMARPRRAIWVILLCGIAAVSLAFAAGGFWWPDGVAATRETYLVSGGSARRAYAYFLVADFAVLGLLTGPAVAYALPGAWRAAVSRARPRAAEGLVALIAGAALAGTLALAVSGVTRGEVERIWVPYAAWMVTAAVLHPPPARRWLAAQALTGLAAQALIMSPW